MPERRLSRLLKVKLLRRSSTLAVPNAGNGADPSVHPDATSRTSPRPSHLFHSTSEKSPYVVSSAADHPCDELAPGLATDRHETPENTRARSEPHPSSPPQSGQRLQHRHTRDQRDCSPPLTEPNPSPRLTPLTEDPPSPLETPIPTPQHSDDISFQSAQVKVRGTIQSEHPVTPDVDTVVERTREERRPSSTFVPPPWTKRPSIAIRRQSLLPASHQLLIGELLEQNLFSANSDGSVVSRAPETGPEMVHRRIWVKRPGGSATLIPCLEDAVVDELRDQVIIKYGNSLGRTFDPPDIMIRIVSREGSSRQTPRERLLSPEEVLSSVLDTYYPGGQKVEEALEIDAPPRRTPKPSPRYHHHLSEPGEHGEYFPLMPLNPNVPTPPTHPSSSGQANAPSISILTTGVAPPLPSPGSRNRHHRHPPLTRHSTSSPTMLGNGTTVTESGVSPHTQAPSAGASQTLPTPPAPMPESPQTKIQTPPAPAVASPRSLRKSKAAAYPGAIFGGLIDGTVPPINVLIVEDNIINQKLLEAFMKRLRVRWKCAANGEEAVRKWRQGGFHLVLMDIQLPVMNGLDATKEIRRLERLNGIGVFPKTASGRSSASKAATSSFEGRPGLQRSVSEEDTLTDLSLFRSPVIIVALTASSLQSDRHEALAAGCNDFLTKPIGFPWLEQKVTEWGCMQALIDYEGWRKWRGFLDSPSSSPPDYNSAASPMQGGSRHDLSRPEPPSPSTSRHAANSKPYHKLQRPPLPGAAEILREDSLASGSGSDDTAESPQTSMLANVVNPSGEPTSAQ